MGGCLDKGRADTGGEAELVCWLKQDPKNQEWFDTFTTRENLKGALSLYASFHTAKRWEELERYCRITNRRKIHPGYWRYVAAVVILFIIGGIGFLYFVPDTRKEMTLAAVGPKEFHQQAVLVLENGKELVIERYKRHLFVARAMGNVYGSTIRGVWLITRILYSRKLPKNGISCESREEANIHWYWRMGAGYG